MVVGRKIFRRSSSYDTTRRKLFLTTGTGCEILWTRSGVTWSQVHLPQKETTLDPPPPSPLPSFTFCHRPVLPPSSSATILPLAPSFSATSFSATILFCHLSGAGCSLNGCRMESQWVQGGVVSVGAGWCLSGCRMESQWVQDGVSMGAGWILNGCLKECSMESVLPPSSISFNAWSLLDLASLRRERQGEGKRAVQTL